MTGCLDLATILYRVDQSLPSLSEHTSQHTWERVLLMNHNLATPAHVPTLGFSPVSGVLIVFLATYRNLARHWLELDLSGPAANALSDSSFTLRLRTDHSLCF